MRWRREVSNAERIYNSKNNSCTTPGGNKLCEYRMCITLKLEVRSDGSLAFGYPFQRSDALLVFYVYIFKFSLKCVILEIFNHQHLNTSTISISFTY